MSKQTVSKTSQHEEHTTNAPRPKARRLPRRAALRDDVMTLQHAAGNRAVDGLLNAGAPSIVEDVLQSGNGQPLEPATLAEMETRFGEDFSQVRVHTDAQAADSATSVDARAFTVGDDVVFGAGEYAPYSASGRHLLAHELAHVVQQSSFTGASSSALSVGSADSRAETAADHAANEAAHPAYAQSENAGQMAAQATVSAPQVQRQEFSPTAIQKNFMKSAVSQYTAMVSEEVLSVLFWYLPPSLRAVASIGFGEEMGTQLVDENKLQSFREKFDEATGSPLVWAQFTGGLAVGYLEGGISPVTGLFDLAVFGETVLNFAIRLASQNQLVLAAEAVSLVHKCNQFADEMKIKFATQLAKWMIENPEKAKNLFASVPIEIARGMGHLAASTLIGAIEAPFKLKSDEDKRKEEEEEKSWTFGKKISHPLGYINSRLEKTDEWIFDTPWKKIGGTVGYILGFASISAVMLVLSEGIGNIMTSVGQILGKASGALGLAGDFLAGIGRAIAAIEAGIAFIAGLALGRLFEGVSELFESIKAFFKNVKKVFGAVESSEKAAAKFLGKGLGEAESLAKLKSEAVQKKLPLLKVEPHPEAPKAPEVKLASSLELPKAPPPEAGIGAGSAQSKAVQTLELSKEPVAEPAMTPELQKKMDNALPFSSEDETPMVLEPPLPHYQGPVSSSVTESDPRMLLSMEEQAQHVQYSPDVNQRANWRSAYRFEPPAGGGAVQFGPRTYIFDANGNLLEASTTQLSLGVRDPVMYANLPGAQAGEDYGHLLGIDFGHIDAQLGHYGGFRQAAYVNRSLGEVAPLWYDAERAALREALQLKQANQPYRVIAEARGYTNGVPAETRIRVLSGDNTSFDSGWILNPVQP